MSIVSHPIKITLALRISKLVLKYACPIRLVACLQWKASPFKHKVQREIRKRSRRRRRRRQSGQVVNETRPTREPARCQRSKKQKVMVCIVPNRCNLVLSCNEALDIAHVHASCPCVAHTYQINRHFDSNHAMQRFLLRISNITRQKTTKAFATNLVRVSTDWSTLVPFDHQKNPNGRRFAFEGATSSSFSLHDVM